MQSIRFSFWIIVSAVPINTLKSQISIRNNKASIRQHGKCREDRCASFALRVTVCGRGFPLPPRLRGGGTESIWSLARNGNQDFSRFFAKICPSSSTNSSENSLRSSSQRGERGAEKSRFSKRRRNLFKRSDLTREVGVHNLISGSFSLRKISTAAVKSLAAVCPQKRHLNLSPLRFPLATRPQTGQVRLL